MTVPTAKQSLFKQKVSPDTVGQVKQALTRCSDENALTHAVCQILTGLDCYSFAWVGYAEPDNHKRVRPVAFCGIKPNDFILAPGEEYLSHQATETAAITASPVIHESASDCCPVCINSELSDKPASPYSLTLPLMNQNDGIGALTIYSAEKDAFDTESQRLLTEIVDYLTFSIMSLRYHPKGEASRNQMTALIDRNPDAILILDGEGSVNFANPAAEALLGRSAKKLVGTPLGLPMTIGETTEIEVLSQLKNGCLAPRIAEYRLVDFSSEQGPQTLAFLRDVTESKIAEQLEMRMGRILEHSWNEIYLFNADTLRFIDTSSGGLHHLGYTLKELQQMTPLDIKPEFDREQFEALLKPLRNGTSQAINLETEHLCKDGSRYPVEVCLQLASEESPKVFISIVQDISERKNYIKELEHKALYDSLTSLPNRNLLHDRLDQLLKLVKRERKSLVVLSISLLGMDDINDLMGYQNRERVLLKVVRRLQKVCRDSDTFARMGDNEFVIILKNATTESALQIGKKVQKAMELPIVIDDVSLEIEIAQGIAQFPDHGGNTKMLLQHADIAMRMAKYEALGISIFSYENVPSSLRQLKLHGELRRAIENNEMTIFYQPKVNIETSSIVGVEALARWFHPQEGLIPPDDFIPMVERSGLIRPFTLWVVKQAVAQLSEWSSKGIDLSIAVNLSARNLLDPEFPATINELLEASEASPHRLCLEITESALMSRPEQAIKIIQQLHNTGIKLSIDDFGTGYSSLSYLKKLPVNELKIDQSFIFGLLDNENDAVIVRSTIDLAHNLGLKTVAEGVESKEIMNQLATLKCDIAQGYYLSRPLPLKELNQWLNSSPWSIPGALK